MLPHAAPASGRSRPHRCHAAHRACCPALQCGEGGWVTTALSEVQMGCSCVLEVNGSATQGVHYAERSRPPAPLPRPAAGLSVSTSFHSLHQLRTEWGPALSYSFLSPIYNSVSKEGYGAADFDSSELREALRTCPWPVVALGGVTPDNVQGCAGSALWLPLPALPG